MISAVILSYNRFAEVIITIDKLEALKTQLPFDLEIIVVDNASTQPIASAIKKQYPHVKVITRTQNKGIAGWNDGFEAATQKYILSLDDDSHPEFGLVDAVSYMEQHQETGILALNVTSGPYLNSMWKWQDKEDVLGFIGCGALIRWEAYQKIGGYADWVKVWAHEWEYSIRCLQAGYHIRHFENSSINHRASLINRSNKRMYIDCACNEMAIIYKYFPAQRWRYIIRMFFNGLKFILAGGFDHTYYQLIGAFKFMKLRKDIKYTPVSMNVQKFYADNFWGTKPVWAGTWQRIRRLKERLMVQFQ